MDRSLLVIGIVLLMPSLAQALTSWSLFVCSSGPVLLDPTVSSLQVNDLSATSVQDCLHSCCLWSSCVAVTRLRSHNVCQLLLIKDASRTPGPPDSHVWRSLGSEAGAEVWKAANFESLIESRRINITVEFQNSSSGRNGSIQQLSINLTGCYQIETWGAAGGSNSFTSEAGGSGAFMSGRFNLTADVQLSIVVGQAGGPALNNVSGAGGGGGSFVFVSGIDGRLLVAAGGGGGASFDGNGAPGQSGVKGADSTAAPAFAGFGGDNGNPGLNDPSMTHWNTNHGGCGAGWLGGPVNPRRGVNDGGGGGSFGEGWVGGLAGSGSTGVGGFGGGGGSGVSDDGKQGAAGAGGGFSGGGAGIGAKHAGGGGGSACNGLDCVGVTGGSSGNQQGRVVLQLVPGFC